MLGDTPPFGINFHACVAGKEIPSFKERKFVPQADPPNASTPQYTFNLATPLQAISQTVFFRITGLSALGGVYASWEGIGVVAPYEPLRHKRARATLSHVFIIF